MQTNKARVDETILLDGLRAARISCPVESIPSPGQFALASGDSLSPLPAALFYTDSAPGGFISSPAPETWTPGMEIFLRGPLGKGFALPASARKIALVAFDDSPSRLRGLIRPALAQGAAVVFVCDARVENLPDEVEALPLSALGEIAGWAEYAAFDTTRENLPRLVERMRELNQAPAWKDAEVLIRTPVTCGGVAECGVCAVVTKSGWKMACKDGPVFNCREI